MNIDPDNPVVALCAAGMAVEGNPNEALALFEQAWATRRNDYEACIAAHFLARLQPTPEAVLHWNAIAVRHAEAATARAHVTAFMASLYLNLGDAHAHVGDCVAALAAVATARSHLGAVAAGGYRDFLAFGIARLEQRLTSAHCSGNCPLPGIDAAHDSNSLTR